MDLQLRNSIYQCNPRCTIEKRNPNKNHLSAQSTTATTTTTAAHLPLTTTKMANTLKSTLYDRFECDHSDKQDPQRNNCLNETVSVSTLSVNYRFIFQFGEKSIFSLI